MSVGNFCLLLGSSKIIPNTGRAGQVEFTEPGTYSWTAPAGINYVSVVAIGGGGAGMISRTDSLGNEHSSSGGSGGGLGWKNFIPVVPGNTYTVVVGAGGIGGTSLTETGSSRVDGGDGGSSYFINQTTVLGEGGEGGKTFSAGTGGGFVGDGGGSGGDGQHYTSGIDGGGGGGAAGYTGDGGDGGYFNGDAGQGGGGGGGAGDEYQSSPPLSQLGGDGGGTGIYGEGTSGAGGTWNSGTASAGGDGSIDFGGSAFGGGGAGRMEAYFNPDANGIDGQSGAVRILWGNIFNYRLFPSTNTQDVEYSSVRGLRYGYTSGGLAPSSLVIDKFSFSSDSNATDVGNLTPHGHELAGQSSFEFGYTSGGFSPGPTVYNVIDKFPFATDGNATDVGDLTVSRSTPAGQSSTESGYTSGAGLPSRDVIDKFPFSSDANATDVGNLTQGRYGPAGQSSSESGYSSSGFISSPSPTNVNTIDKFPFSADVNATDVGDLTQARSRPAGQSSTESGYTSGGRYSTTEYDTIDKFPFSSDTNATDVGDLTQTRGRAAGQSSTESGYTSGGEADIPLPSRVTTIDKFPFSADVNATDVGDLTVDRISAAGNQV